MARLLDTDAIVFAILSSRLLRGEWLPYAGAIVVVTAWPAAAPLLVMFAKRK
jgi:hypothetical protein